MRLQDRGAGRRGRVLGLLAIASLSIGLLAAGCGDRGRQNELTENTAIDSTAASDEVGTSTADPSAGPPIEPVTIDGRTFNLELAATPPYRNRGLMYRRTIADDGGMLFVFIEPEIQNFWMGWCLTDIDIIYLDSRGRVTATYQMRVEPPQRPEETEDDYRLRMPHYSSRLPSQFVIEFKGGTLNGLEVAIGDTIAIDVDRLAALAR